jgi:uncharacterized protein YbjT (DUF2867 family)
MAKTIAVTGATGHIGSVIVERLKAKGHTVRPVSRRAGVNLDDVAALTRVFTGADAVFLMIPPEVTAPDIRKRQNEAGEKLAQAASAAKVRRVVLLSSIGGHLAQGTGPVVGLHDMEERLRKLSFPEKAFMRPTYFMENHLVGIGMIQQMGLYGSAMRPDVPFPMIATRDIGEKAAEFLTEEPFHQPEVRELFGPRDYTMAEATRILGAAIGKPDLKYMQFPYEDARKAMIGMGLSPSYAGAIVEMSQHFNDSKSLGTEKRSAQNTTPTTLEQFAQDVFQKAYGSAATGAQQH